MVPVGTITFIFIPSHVDYYTSHIPDTTDLQAAGGSLQRASPRIPQALTILVNFPQFWKMCFDMVKTGSGYEFKYRILAPGTNLRESGLIPDSVDIANLPKAIGGGAISFDENGKEDETCTQGVRHPTLSEFLKSLGEGEI